MVDERRGEERFTLPLEARWEGLSGQYSARISDLSLGGCYIESLAQVVVGSELQFEIRLPTGLWMPLRGTIVYQQPSLGFGVRFAHLTLMERNLLMQVLNSAGNRRTS
jgi:hypothetical protein